MTAAEAARALAARRPLLGAVVVIVDAGLAGRRAGFGAEQWCAEPRPDGLAEALHDVALYPQRVD